jgi:hypothetical protein
MQYHSMGTSALLALLISAGLATAQTTTTTTSTTIFETALTTGIVGWAPATQTAQVNALNVTTVVAVAATSSTGTTATTTTTCTVELEFVDAQNNVLKSAQVSNIAQGTAASLTLKLADLSTATNALRVSIRAVVKYNPFVSGPIIGGIGPTIPVSSTSTCSVMPTLELFDTATGATQTFTSETRVSGSAVVPLLISSTVVN